MIRYVIQGGGRLKRYILLHRGEDGRKWLDLALRNFWTAPYTQRLPRGAYEDWKYQIWKNQITTPWKYRNTFYFIASSWGPATFFIKLRFFISSNAELSHIYSNYRKLTLLYVFLSDYQLIIDADSYQDNKDFFPIWTSRLWMKGTGGRVGLCRFALTVAQLNTFKGLLMCSLITLRCLKKSLWSLKYPLYLIVFLLPHYCQKTYKKVQ